MSSRSCEDLTINVKLKISNFSIPPITDALVIGKNAPIGSKALLRALKLLHVAPFDHVLLDDEVIADLLVRQTLLKKVPEKRLVKLVIERIKPLMSPEEVLHLDINPELQMEEQL